MLSQLKSRLPERDQWMPILSTVVLATFSWAIIRALYQMTGWIFYLTVPNIISIMAYTLGFALLESLAVAGLVVALDLFLPWQWKISHLNAIGIVQALLLTLAAYLLRDNFDRFQKLADWQLIAIPGVLLLSIILSAPPLSSLFDRFPRLADGIKTLGERLTIFSYIYIPLGICGWLVVLIRNLA